jgi:hypothetical protein
VAHKAPSTKSKIFNPIFTAQFIADFYVFMVFFYGREIERLHSLYFFLVDAPNFGLSFLVYFCKNETNETPNKKIYDLAFPVSAETSIYVNQICSLIIMLIGVVLTCCFIVYTNRKDKFNVLVRATRERLIRQKDDSSIHLIIMPEQFNELRRGFRGNQRRKFDIAANAYLFAVSSPLKEYCDTALYSNKDQEKIYAAIDNLLPFTDMK